MARAGGDLIHGVSVGTFFMVEIKALRTASAVFVIVMIANRCRQWFIPITLHRCAVACCCRANILWQARSQQFVPREYSISGRRARAVYKIRGTDFYGSVEDYGCLRFQGSVGTVSSSNVSAAHIWE